MLAWGTLPNGHAALPADVAGQVTAEYVGVLLLVAVIVGTLVSAGPASGCPRDSRGRLRDRGDDCGSALARRPPSTGRRSSVPPASSRRCAAAPPPSPPPSRARPGGRRGARKGAPGARRQHRRCPDPELRYRANAGRSGARSRAWAAGVPDGNARLRKLRELDDPDRHFLLFDHEGDGAQPRVRRPHERPPRRRRAGMNSDLDNLRRRRRARRYRARCSTPTRCDHPVARLRHARGRHRAGEAGAAEPGARRSRSSWKGSAPSAASACTGRWSATPTARWSPAWRVRAGAAGRRDGAGRLARGRGRARERTRRRQRLGRARPVGRGGSSGGTAPTPRPRVRRPRFLTGVISGFQLLQRGLGRSATSV